MEKGGSEEEQQYAPQNPQLLPYCVLSITPPPSLSTLSIPHAGGEVEAHEARDALLGAALVYLENVLLGCEREDLAGKGNVDVGHGGEVVAVDRRLAAGARDLGAGL